MCGEGPVNASSFHSLIHSSVRFTFNVCYFPAADMKGEALIEVSPEICFLRVSGVFDKLSKTFQAGKRRLQPSAFPSVKRFNGQE